MQRWQMKNSVKTYDWHKFSIDQQAQLMIIMLVCNTEFMTILNNKRRTVEGSSGSYMFNGSFPVVLVPHKKCFANVLHLYVDH